MKPSPSCARVPSRTLRGNDTAGLVVGFLLVALATAGCGGGGGTPHGGGGAGGGAAGGAGGGAACPAGVVGALSVAVVGLPVGVLGNVTVTGPGGPTAVTATQSMPAVASGTYTTTAAIVVAPDPIVRTVYVPTVTPPSLCVGAALAQSVTITYAAVPSSNKVWVDTSDSPGNINPAGYASATLTATGAPAATVALTTAAGRIMAFDRDGNLWSNGGTVADPTLLRIPAGQLGLSGAPAPDRMINVAGACIVAVSSLAFAPNGDLWVGSTCGHAMMRVSAAQLAVSGDVVPAVAIPVADPMDVAGLAFDKLGNLWLGTGDGHVLRFDAATLTSSAAVPARTLTVMGADGSERNPGILAFDAAGNLWGNDFGGNAVFAIPAATLAGSGAAVVMVPVTVTIGVASLLGGMAFDEGGGLWVTLGLGTFGRLSPAQLGVASGPGNPTTPERIITSATIGYSEDVALYPAPAALPLYSALP